MKCMKVKDIPNYMLSLDISTIEDIIVKDKYYMYTAKLQATYDYRLMRCRPNQSLSGRRVMFDPRTIAVCLPEDAAVRERNSRPQMCYFDQSTGRINSRQEPASQSIGVTISYSGGDGISWVDEPMVESIDE